MDPTTTPLRPPDPGLSPNRASHDGSEGADGGFSASCRIGAQVMMALPECIPDSRCRT